MGTARSVAAADMAGLCAELLAEVQNRHVTIDIRRGDTVVAHITPAGQQRGVPLDKLDKILSALPHLASNDVDAFLSDMHAGLSPLSTSSDAWES